MSLAESRAAIVAALEGAPGVKAYAKPPGAPKPGDAFPTWAGAQAPEGGAYALAYLNTWTVWIIVPADPVAADQWVDEHVDGVLEALAPALALNGGYRPERFRLAGSEATYNALVLSGETE